MENVKNWIIKNWSTSLVVMVTLLLLFSTDAKAWLMRQVAATGILNKEFSIRTEEETTGSSEQIIDFVVRKENGSLINVANLKGKVVFINFWASWCPPCRAEFPSIQAFYEKYNSNPDIVFLTVNLDDNSELGKVYLEDKGFTVPFLVPNGEIPAQYFTGSLPTTVVLDKNGKIRFHHQGLADYSHNNFYNQINTLLKE